MVAGPHDLLSNKAVEFQPFPGLDDCIGIEGFGFSDRFEKERDSVIPISNLSSRPGIFGFLALLMPPLQKCLVLLGIDRGKVSAVHEATHRKLANARKANPVIQEISSIPGLYPHLLPLPD